MIIMDYSQIAISSVLAEVRGVDDVELSLPLLRHMILNTIRSNRVKFTQKYGELVIACDAKNYWRKESFPYYKASRKKKRSNIDVDWDFLYNSIDTVRQELHDFFPYPVVYVNRAEADDVIATLTEVYHQQESILVLSGDYDFVQLQQYPNVKQYAPVQKKWIEPVVSPEVDLNEHVLRGDDGDGIPNFLSDDDTFVVEGKRQKPIFNAKMEDWKLQPLSSWDPKSSEGKRIARNQKLIDFSYIPEAIREDIINTYQQQCGKNRSQLLNYFTTHGMKLMLGSIGDF